MRSLSTTRLLAISSVLFLFGCATTISEEASEVQVHSQVSSIVNDCQKLGPVRVSASSSWSTDHAYRQAKADLRQAALDQYGADTVVIVNSDEEVGFFTGESHMNGIAYDCFK